MGPYPNTLHLLGGGVDEGESLEEALKREVREEAGIEIDVAEQIGFDEDYEENKHGEKTHYVFLIYKANYISGEPEPKDDIVELIWIPKNELPRNELNRPSLKLFEKMGYLK